MSARPPVVAAGVAATVDIPEAELEAELPEIDADAVAQEFSGKLPGLEEAARIAAEMSAQETPSKPSA